MYGNTVKSAYELDAKNYNIAAYLRISQEDGANIESNSIKNQREIINSFVSDQSEFKAVSVIDYIDDGISGSRTEREAYQRLLRDIERGVIDCIIVKDLSRIGRNLIDVDDLLMNFLVTMNVRFIAINNGYDSFINPLSNLELAVINLANQHYNKDLAIKSITAKQVKSKRGEYLSHAPFGYIKSETVKNKLIPDDEAAEYVRMIFSLAASGHRTVEIAKMLNSQGIPSPSVYKIRNGWKNMWTQVIDPDYCFWTSGVIYKLLKNEVYTGSVVANKFKVIEPGTGRSITRPPEEWIVVKNAHEPLVSEDNFQKAQLILPRKKYFSTPEHIFGNKIKCPSCGHAMIHYTKQNPRFKCGTAKFTEHYGCKSHSILQSEIEKTVIASIRVYVDALINREEIRLAKINKSKISAKDLESKITAAYKSIDALEASVTKMYTLFMDGKKAKDTFLNKKSTVNDIIARKRSEIEQWKEQLQSLTEERNSAENTIKELSSLQEFVILNREIVNHLIDKILVHSETDIEIVWNGSFSENIERL